MEAKPTVGRPGQPARDDRAVVVDRLVDRLPARVEAALSGDREALIGLLMSAADFSWQSRADTLGTVEEVATATHRLADDVATCYSADQPPSDRMCDSGFEVADRVDALAVEVLHLRSRDGIAGDATLLRPKRSPIREARHLARAHLAALRDATAAERPVSEFDVQAAENLYQVIVTANREQNRQNALDALKDPAPTPPADAIPNDRRAAP